MMSCPSSGADHPTFIARLPFEAHDSPMSPQLVASHIHVELVMSQRVKVYRCASRMESGYQMGASAVFVTVQHIESLSWTLNPISRFCKSLGIVRFAGGLLGDVRVQF
jgi:hypothetical protein